MYCRRKPVPPEEPMLSERVSLYYMRSRPDGIEPGTSEVTSARTDPLRHSDSPCWLPGFRCGDVSSLVSRQTTAYLCIASLFIVFTAATAIFVSKSRTCAFSCAWCAKCTGMRRNALLENAFCPPTTAECACAALINKDGGRPWKRWISNSHSRFNNIACDLVYNISICFFAAKNCHHFFRSVILIDIAQAHQYQWNHHSFSNTFCRSWCNPLSE
jgi:hypothetical protein